MPDRNTKPVIDILNFQGLSTKLNPDLLEHNQLVVSENTDYYFEFGSLEKSRGSSRVLDDIYTETAVAQPASWIGYYKSQDFSGQLIRNTIAQLGTTIQKINTDGTITALPVGAVTSAPTTGVAQPVSLFRDHDLFDRLMLVTAQDQFKGGRRGTFFKYDGFRASNWGVIAPGRQETIVQGFESPGVFFTSNCTLSSEDTIAFKDNSVKMLKTAATASCYFELLNTTSSSFNNTVNDRGEVRLYIPQDEYRGLALSGRAISVYFGSDTTLANNYFRFDFLIGQLAPGWNILSFDFSSVPSGDIGTSVGALDTTAVKSYKFEALFNTQGTANVVDLYWDHLVALDEGTPKPTFSGLGAGEVFVPSDNSVWQYMTTFINEYGTESNAGPASEVADLRFYFSPEVVKVSYDSAASFTITGDATIAANSVTKTQGVASIVVSKPGGSSVSSGFTNTSALSLDLSVAKNGLAYIDLRLATGVRSLLDPTAFTIYLLDSTGSNYYKYIFDRDEVTESDWTTLTLDLTNPDDIVGGLDLTDVDFISVVCTFLAAGTITASYMAVDNFRIFVNDEYSTINLTRVPISVDPAVVARNIYRTVAGGTEFLFVGTINDNVTTTYSDILPDASLGLTTPPEPGLFNDNSPPPFCSMMKVWKRTVFMAGDPLAPNVLYFSRDDEPEAFPIINGFELDTPITGMYETSLGLIVTTETDYWRVIGDNPDYFVDKVRKGMGNVGFRACGESRLYGWTTDRDGVRLFDLRDTNKVSDIIRDKFDDFQRQNLEQIWSIHSRGKSLILFAIPDDTGTYVQYLIYQYGGNDDIRQGWWWTFVPPADVEFLCAEEIEDANGDFHLYAGGNDGMIYELFAEDADNFVNAAGTPSAVTLRFKTAWIRAGILGAELEGATGRARPTYVELRAREETGATHTWSILCETADGSATDEVPRDSTTLSMIFPAGKGIQRYRPQNLTPGEYIRFTVTNSQLDVHTVFQGMRVWVDVAPSQSVIYGDNPSGQG